MIVFAHPLSCNANTCVFASSKVWSSELNVIFDFDESLKQHHQEITTAFILDANVKAVFTNEKSEISPDLFYPGAPLGKYHIPNYIYVQLEIRFDYMSKRISS